PQKNAPRISPRKTLITQDLKIKYFEFLRMDYCKQTTYKNTPKFFFHGHSRLHRNPPNYPRSRPHPFLQLSVNHDFQQTPHDEETRCAWKSGEVPRHNPTMAPPSTSPARLPLNRFSRRPTRRALPASGLPSIPPP